MMPPDDPITLLLQLYQRLLHLYPEHASLFRAMLRLHEIENVKLAWRAIARRADRRAWTPLWLLLGDLATIDINDARNSLHSLVSALAKTPYETIANRVMLACGNDIAAAEMVFDRWASAELEREAAKLPRAARQLVETVVRERDAELFVHQDVFSIRQERMRLCRRAMTADPFGIAPAIAVLLLYEEKLRGLTALIEQQRTHASVPPLTRTA